MPHEHPAGIDLTVIVFVVNRGRLLLVHHRKEGKWLAPGGHVEPNETPDEAAVREVREETGLDIEFISPLPTAPFVNADHQLLRQPDFVSIHRLVEIPEHRHLVLHYLARSATDQATLAAAEHHSLRWFTRNDLADSSYGVPQDILWFGQQALGRAGE